ncbi:MAG: hypothetical protein WCQ72_04170 [Eubacteriales bacterium]
MAQLTLKITKRDKTLIYILCIGILIFVFFRFVFTPLSEDIGNLEIELEQAENDKFDMQSLISRRDALITENDELRSYRSQLTGGLYPQMESYAIDRLVTYMMMEYGLETTDFKLSESSSNALLRPYIYSSLQAAEGENAVSDVTTSSLTLKVNGSRAALAKLIDHIVNDLTSMRITSYGFRDVSVDSGYDKNGGKLTDDTTQLTLALEIYMY